MRIVDWIYLLPWSNNFLTPIPNKVHNVKSNAIGLQHLNSYPNSTGLDFIRDT